VLSEELLSDILRRTLSSGGDFADVFVEWRRPGLIVFEDGRVENISTGTVAGVGIRLVFGGGRTAYAVVNDRSPGALLDAAGSLARAAGGAGEENPVLDLRTARPGASFEFSMMPDEVDTGEKIALVTGAEKEARAAGPDIRQVRIAYRDWVQRVQVATSEGRLSSETRVHTVCMAHAVAERGGVVQTGSETVAGLRGFEIFDDEPLGARARSAAERAIRLLSARRAPGGRMPVVISSEAGGTMIHEAIGHGLEGDLAGQGLSRFSGQVGRKVASPLVTVVDDPTLPGRRGSYGFDDEGTPSGRTVLVRDGVLEGFMHDRLSAMRTGSSPTGNGRRESYLKRPIPRMSNTFIAPGTSEPDEVLRSTGKGLLVRRMGGGQVNTVNGDFVFDVMEGYMIEGGMQGEPVRGATLTGNGPRVLMAMDMVGSDLGFSVGTCGKDSQGVPVSDAMPTVRVPELVVGGEAG
jgi:TldD protein